QWEISQTKIRVISTLLFVLFGCLLFVALPTTVFQHIEGWSALESLYFVVVTLTTIGFGDFVAGRVTAPLCSGWTRHRGLVGEIRAHAAEWTANVSAEFKETRRRVSIEIYDKFQRAASIKRKLSTDLGLSPAPELSLPSTRRGVVSVNYADEREREAALQALITPLAKNGRFFLNGLDPEMGDISIIENLK
ncbi:hypothetical protein CRUP_029452, partial [Coryphaenoides rupestris]